MEKIIGKVKLQCLCGDITQQKDIEAIVNAANAQLLRGGGVCGAIHRAAGAQLEKEARQYAPISPGEAVITGAYNLPNKYVIHTLGPVYGQDKPESKFLSDCYKNSLKLADEKGISSIAFPAISCGIFGYPIEEAAEVAIAAVVETVPQLKNIKTIRFMLFSSEDLSVYENIFSRL